MVGRGFLRPDARRVRQDAPQALKRLFEDCIKFDREQRPLFRQILASLESMLRAMPKITRSASEPNLNRQLHASDDYLSYSCASPKTPVNFQFNTDTSFPAFYGYVRYGDSLSIITNLLRWNIVYNDTYVLLQHPSAQPAAPVGVAEGLRLASQR